MATKQPFLVIGDDVCPAKPVSALESAPNEQQNSSNLPGNALVQLCDLMKEQNQILKNLSSQLSLLMQAMAEEQGSEDGGFTSLDQT